MTSSLFHSFANDQESDVGHSVESEFACPNPKFGLREAAKIVPEVTAQQLQKRQIRPHLKLLYVVLYLVAIGVVYSWFRLWQG
jgi:hypothetical protein